jgi:hypothetical protein
MADTDRSGTDAFEAFRSYLEKEIAPLLPAEKREPALDGIIRAAYTFGGALLRRGAGGAGDYLASMHHPGSDDQADEEEAPPPSPSNVVGFPAPSVAREELL